MADQASMSAARGTRGNDPNPGPGQRKGVTGPSNGNGNGNGVLGRLTDFGNDVFTLGELQARLTAIDAKVCAARAGAPLSAGVVGVILATGAVPVALLGVADLLARALAITPGWAMLLTASVVVTIAGIVVYVSGRQLGRSLTAFRRSSEELERNIAWLRTVLVHSGRPVPKRKV